MASLSGKPASLDDFRTVKQLGSGAFGSVSKVQRISDQKIFALKKVIIGKMEEREVADALNECRILASLRHPRIVNFECAFSARNGSELNLVMELCANGDLSGRIKKCQQKRRRVDERAIWAHLVEMTEGLVYLHSKNISHRDLKPANVFLASDGTCKLGDLNVSKILKGQDDLMSTKIGTPYYMAPEVWSGKKYDSACDVWSMGCVIYELAALAPPFQGNSLAQLKRIVMQGRFSQLPPSYSPQFARMVGMLLKTDPRKRISATAILEDEEIARRRRQGMLAHPAAETDDADDIELMATIKPPKNRMERQKLNDKLQAMSVQASTASSNSSRSELQPNSALGKPAQNNRRELGGLGGGLAPVTEAEVESMSAQIDQVNNIGRNVGRGSLAAVTNDRAVRKPEQRRSDASRKPSVAQHQQPRRSEPRRSAASSSASNSDLPSGWKMVKSQSRPGQFSYLNVNTGERVAERPTRAASTGGPLPQGWTKVRSQSRPGEWVYMNTVTGERIAWRPTAPATRYSAVRG